MTPVGPRTRVVPDKGRSDYSYESLKRLAHILVLSGHSPKDLLNKFQEICSTWKEPSRRWDPSRLGFIADLPHVIALWYSDPQYLGARGHPAALPFRGHPTSLRSLIQRVLPGEDPKEVMRALVRMRGIRRRGVTYIPTGRNLAFREDSARLHGMNALLGILRTVERNVGGAPNAAICERSAINPNFPVRALRAFHRRFKRRAADFLWETDGDMRRCEAEVTGGLRTRVGVEVFAFEELPSDVAPKRKRRTVRSRVEPPARVRGTRGRKT